MAQKIGVILTTSTLPETNSSPLKMDGWNTTFLLGRPIFRCELLVSGRVTIYLLSGVIQMAVSWFIDWGDPFTAYKSVLGAHPPSTEPGKEFASRHAPRPRNCSFFH